MPPVSVVIPNWNGAGLLDRALACVRRQTLPAAEVVVVDNGSSDGSIALAQNAGARVVALGGNLGFCRAVNRGIETATGDWIAILNNDVEIADDWLARLLDRALVRGAWFAAGKLIASECPAHLDGAWDALCRGACAWRCGAARPDGPLWNRERTIRLAPFTAALFRADLFRRAGLLDELFESYLEDVDFGIRCAIAGYSGVYVPEAVARHKGSATLGRWHPETVRHISRNQLLLVARHFPPDWIARYGWPILVGQLLWGLVALRHGAGPSYVKGKLEGMRLFRSVRKDARSSAAALAILLRESENEIRDLQRQTGYDLYWRLYFALT